MRFLSIWKGNQRINEHVVNAVLAVAIGLISAIGAIVFRFMIKYFQYLFYHNTRDFLTFHHTLPLYWKILMPALGGLVVGPLIYFGARETKGHGVPEIMEALLLRRGVYGHYPYFLSPCLWRGLWHR